MRRVGTCLIPVLAIGLALPASSLANSNDVVAVFTLRGALTEQPDSSGISALLGGGGPPSMFKLLENLRSARTDQKVRAVIFDIDEAGLGFAQIQELRKQFEALRAADKEVWVFTESLSPGTMILGSAASKLMMVPAGDVALVGLYSEALYFKNLLDKIGMSADILHCGDYKSAGEPFYRTGPSKEAEEQTNALLDSLFDNMLKDIAKSRKLDKDRVKELVDRGLLSAEEALEAKLVDKLVYREDFVETIKDRYGDDVKVDTDYGAKKGPELDLNSPFGMFSFFSEIMKMPSASSNPAVAVVYVEGPITSGKSEPSLFGGVSNAGSDTVRKAIAEASNDPSVKALVLRVDSPGGSALASDIICEATERFIATGRPFIVSMGNVAGSGGYYVSTAGQRIFAEPTTITGSIGVVGGKFVTKGFWDWLGVTSHEYQRGEIADIMNSNRPFDEKERKVISKYMYSVYDEFKQRVLDGRKNKLPENARTLEGMESIAGGRVYTGEQALKIGLVDELGGLSDAIKYAADEANVSQPEIRVYPRPKTLMDLITEALTGEEKGDKFIVQPSAVRDFSQLPAIGAAMDGLKSVDPAKAKALEGLLIQLQMFSKERVLMIGPALPLFHH